MKTETYSLHTYTLTQQAGNIYWKVVYVSESQGSVTLSLSLGGLNESVKLHLKLGLTFNCRIHVTTRKRKRQSGGVQCVSGPSLHSVPVVYLMRNSVVSTQSLQTNIPHVEVYEHLKVKIKAYSLLMLDHLSQNILQDSLSSLLSVQSRGKALEARKNKKYYIIPTHTWWIHNQNASLHDSVSFMFSIKLQQKVIMFSKIDISSSSLYF